MPGPRTLRVLITVFALALVVTSCSDDDADAARSPVEGDPPQNAESAGDSTLTRVDVSCEPGALGDGDDVRFVSAHYVVDGRLGSLCLGEEDPTIFAAWANLAAIADPVSLRDLALFAGFDLPDPDGENTTLAFVNVANDGGTAFQMSVNLDAYDEDLDDATLTMAHEFSHVFTSVGTQLDRSEEAAVSCATYDNGDGCFLPGSIMARWIAMFWDDGLIDEIDPEVDPEPAAGEQRCSLDDRFLGWYAASNPEEDFAETFSAFVHRVEAPTAGVRLKYDWLAAQPELAAYRDRAAVSGLDPISADFEQCG